MAESFFHIEGGQTLSSEIDVRGSKNAAAPIFVATLLTREPCVLHNVPRIEDIFRLLEILESMGSKVEWSDEGTVRIENADIDPSHMRSDLVKKIRMSILLLGSLSARFDSFSLACPGGCAIGARPVETHFDALRKLGVETVLEEKQYIVSSAHPVAGTVVMKEFSVTATEIAMILAASIPETTVIKIAAAEPHVEDLGRFLMAMGASIEGLGTHTLLIRGMEQLHGAEHAVIPDPIEAATFLILGAATKSPLVVRHARREHLDLVLQKLGEFGVRFEYPDDDTIRVVPAEILRSPGKVKAEIYPGIPTDALSLFGVLATLAEGETMIHDHFYEGRFNYVPELEKMGVSVTVLNPHQAIIRGTKKLKGAKIKSFDLRAGAALIIAALAAEGVSEIGEVYQVDRGYEHIEERLQAIGAKIERVES